MDSSMVWEFGNLLDAGISFVYDNVGNKFNYAVVVFGFLGFFYWMTRQAKYNKEAESNPDQIK